MWSQLNTKEGVTVTVDSKRKKETKSNLFEQTECYLTYEYFVIRCKTVSINKLSVTAI